MVIEVVSHLLAEPRFVAVSVVVGNRFVNNYFVAGGLFHARLLVALGGEVVGNQLHGLLVSFVRKQITRFLAARKRAGGKSH